MNLCKKDTIAHHYQKSLITCPDYSEILDVDLYRGGYNDLYFQIHYTCSDNYLPHSKVINLLYITQEHLSGQYIDIDINYKFYKMVDGGGLDQKKYFIYKYEQLSTQELRDDKLKDII